MVEVVVEAPVAVLFLTPVLELMEVLITLHVQDKFIKVVSTVQVVMVLVATVALEVVSTLTVHLEMGMLVLHL